MSLLIAGGDTHAALRHVAIIEMWLFYTISQMLVRWLVLIRIVQQEKHWGGANSDAVGIVFMNDGYFEPLNGGDYSMSTEFDHHGGVKGQL